MRCTSCDGMKVRPVLNGDDEPCRECAGLGVLPDSLVEEKARAVTARVGMVYFIRDDINQRVKIGTSLNPFDRLRDLQTGSSVRLRLMAICEGGGKGEREFHKAFDERRLDGEWFDDSDRHVTRILLISLRDGSFWPDSEGA